MSLVIPALEEVLCVIVALFEAVVGDLYQDRADRQGLVLVSDLHDPVDLIKWTLVAHQFQVRFCTGLPITDELGRCNLISCLDNVDPGLESLIKPWQYLCR
jgi:hypothetical protein